MEKTQLMQELWRKSEQTTDPREKKLLEIAGNLVEATFTTNHLHEVVASAITDALPHSSSMISNDGHYYHTIYLDGEAGEG